jgi:NAD(P)H-quinone oxidoreductase subunit 5
MVDWAESIWATSPWLVGILAAVNGLTAFNFVRVFGLVFLGKPQPKTRRAPEVNWLMAVPMVSLSIFNLLVPSLLLEWGFLPRSNQIDLGVLVLLLGSGLLGVGLGGWMYWGNSRPSSTVVGSPLRDLFAYDFFIDRLYGMTVVLGVVQGSRFTAWFDRYIVDGVVNFVGVASLFSGESLKYTISGQSRTYLLSLFIGFFIVLSTMAWMLNWSLP